MARRFKSSKRKNILLVLIFLISLLFILKIGINAIIKLKIYKSNHDLITYLVTDNNHLLPQNKKNYVSDLVSMVSNIDIKKPVSIIKNTFSFNNYYLDDIDNFLNNPKENKKPIIYLYSSNFSKELINNYDINSTIILIYILKGLLDKNKLPTEVLNNDLTELISLNNKNSYDVSRLYLKEAFDKYDLKLALDIQIGDNENIIINDKRFAKINFIINPNYEENLRIVDKLVNIISENYSEILNDNLQVEDNLNEDLNNNILVLNIGSEDSTLEEIYNTFNVISDSIKNYLEDING